MHWKSRPYSCTILTVESNSFACLKTSLMNGGPITVPTQDTVVAGLNCETVSSIAWPLLKNGVDAAVSVSDTTADQAVRKLENLGLDVGPCGAATYAALQLVAKHVNKSVFLDENSVVVLFCTEGRKEYKIL